jgi:hypothetical protein
VLRALLRRTALRLAVAAAVRGLARLSAALALGVLGWALASLIFPIPVPLRELAVCGAGGLLPAGAFLMWRRWPALPRAARIADARLGLADRLSTALELLDRHQALRGLARLQVADAAEAASGVRPRGAAPVRWPRELWVTLGSVAAIALWAQFLRGFAVPGMPAARTAAVIHFEGRSLSAVARRLESTSRARGLPEARRAAPGLRDLGQQLQGSRVTRSDALRLLQDAGRRLAAAQSRIERRLGAPAPGTSGEPSAGRPPSAGPDSTRLQQSLRELETLAGRLRAEPGAPRDDIAQRLGEVARSLEQMNAPISTREALAAARRALDRGRPGAAAAALGDALQDVEGMDRMLSDEQAVGEARRQVEKSAERVAKGGPIGSDRRTEAQASPDSTSRPEAPGPNPPAQGPEDAAPPPPGPNQGSKPGQGRGGRMGPPAPRLGGTRVEQHLSGRQGEGTMITRELLAPGRAAATALPAVRVPTDVAHANDRALAQNPLPPAYRALVREYFRELERGR